MAQADEHKIRQYLLGQLSEADEGQIEVRLLSEPDYAEEYDIIVDELIDDYLAGKFESDELKRVEEYFFKSGERQNKLKFAMALKKRKSSVIADRTRKTRSLTSYLAIAAALLLIIGAGFYLWRLKSDQADLNKGLTALQAAFHDERPVEARISKLDYAPYLTTRGPGTTKVDQDELRRAELTLLDALKKRPTPALQHALGKVYLAKQDFDKAIERFDEALKGDPNNAQLHNDLGVAWLERGKAERANDKGKSLEYFGRSLGHLDRALELNDSLLEPRFNRALLYQYMKLPQARDAWRAYLERDPASRWADEARHNLETLDQQDKQTSQTKAGLYDRFVAAYRNSDSNAAWEAIVQSRSRLGNQIVEQLLEEHLNLAAQGNATDADTRLRMLSFAGEVESHQVGDLYTRDLARFYSRATTSQRRELGRARSLKALANQRYDQSEFETAIPLYQQAAKEFAQTGDHCEVLFVESWIGYCELRLADNESQKRFERLSRVYEEKGYKSLFAQALHAQSDALTRSNELSRVLDYAGKALKLAETIQDDPTRLRSLQQFVAMNRQFGNYAESLKYGMDALDIAQRAWTDSKVAWTLYHDIAQDFYWLNLSDGALQFEMEALRLAQESDWPFITTRSYTQLGIIYVQRDDYDDAIRSGIRALEEGQRIKGERSRLNVVSHASMSLGHIYRQARDFNNAIINYDNALHMFEQLDLGMFLYEGHKGKFLALKGLGDYSGADEELTETLKLLEEYRPKIIEEHNRDSFFDVGQDTYDLAIDFAFSTVNNPERAFEYAERSRARSLLDLTHASQEKTSVDEGPRANHSTPIAPLGLNAIRQSLPQPVQILQYCILGDKLIIWVVSREGIDSRVVQVSANDLQQKALVYARSVGTDGSTQENANAARDLYDILITPVESLLDENKLICIVPDKSLTNLPYSALVSPASGKFFIEKYRWIFSQSSNMFITCTEEALKKQQPDRETILSVGNPTFAREQFPSLQELPAAEREAREVARYYHSQPLLGRDAQESSVRAALQSVDVVHLASHFVINSSSPGLSELLLAAPSERSVAGPNSDGVLQAFEVEQMKLSRTRLVVLSACKTGIERTYQGEGAIGIARSFISAGVPLVVASLWPVQSEATADFMIAFHKYRKVFGLSSVEALRKTQLEMLAASDERLRRPGNWASFVAFGGYANF